jgi:hypothetical protein
MRYSYLSKKLFAFALSIVLLVAFLSYEYRQCIAEHIASKDFSGDVPCLLK